MLALCAQPARASSRRPEPEPQQGDDRAPRPTADGYHDELQRDELGAPTAQPRYGAHEVELCDVRVGAAALYDLGEQQLPGSHSAVGLVVAGLEGRIGRTGARAEDRGKASSFGVEGVYLAVVDIAVQVRGQVAKDIEVATVLRLPNRPYPCLAFVLDCMVSPPCLAPCVFLAFPRLP